MMMMNKLCSLSSWLLLSLTAATTTTTNAAAAAAAHAHAATSKASKIPYIRKEELPQEWESLGGDVEFVSANQIENLPVNTKKILMDQSLRHLEDSSSYSYGTTEEEDDDDKFNVYKVQPFVEGISNYDEYQQAWRLLGFMIDCNAGKLYDDDDGGSGSGDKGTGEGCMRYVLWAAYVDLDYEGGGIGEYQYYNRKNGKWDETPCYVGQNGGKSRCAKMDCHEENTNWSLLGFFKHKSLDDWMEQLFKHEGICVWTEEEYAFMKNARDTWPETCSDSYYTTSSGDSIYYDVKPVAGGGITLGLYTDTACVEEYQSKGRNDPVNVENVLGGILSFSEASHDSGDYNSNYDFSGWSLSDSMSYWDSALDIFKVCQPCVAYDLNNYGYTTDDDRSKGSNYYNAYADDGGNYDDGDDFDCYDDADYTNVNQCMKFMAKTTMNTATFRDLTLGKTQGTLVNYPFTGNSATQTNYRKLAFGTFFTYVFFLFSTAVCLLGVVSFVKVRRETGFEVNLKEPLAVMT